MKHSVSLAAALAAAVSLGAAATATAADTFATWSCRASAVELQLGQNSRVAPILSDRSPCSDGSVGVPNVGEALGLAPNVTARTAYAITQVKPPTGFPKDQTIGATAGVEGLVVDVIPGLKLTVDAAQSNAGASCASGAPVFTGASKVAALKINDQEVLLDSALTSVVDPVSQSPLGAVVQVKLNEQIKTADGITQRAAHVIVLSGQGGGGTPVADIVIAESKLASSNACDPNAVNNRPVGGSGTDGLQVCPSGSTLDARGLCVILAANTAGQGLTVVGVPFSGPSGGRVVALDVARKRFTSPCLSGPGPKFVVVGTNKRDRITGTNRPDRILGLGGNDALDGGRGNDCIDGGTGGDSMSGALGNDRIFGMSGKDHLNGGPGTDRLSGGTGNDSINAAFGQDKVFGGPGIDFINVATAGKPATVNCGTGRDKVRVNANEKRRTKGCEIRYVFKDR